MRADLSSAMKTRQLDVTRVLRTALAAIANAEAPPQSSAPLEVRGRLADLPRLVLTNDDHVRIVAAEIADREDTAAQYERNGRTAEAAEMRTEIAILAAYL
ncbi:MAG TPA: GatB/YqeY domain-containing protein [Acidimicrobiales bacterium]|nr:GatB/YqeY domain-containing protein [Acidimicrobiales bacterium]